MNEKMSFDVEALARPQGERPFLFSLAMLRGLSGA